MTWTLQDIPDLDGKTFVVTGANSGLGLEVTRALTRCGAKVIMACRNPDKAEKARGEIGENATVELVNLGSLASVHACTQRILERYPALDGLINNAGIMMTPYGLTEDGVELQFGTNHLGHFALTSGLLPALSNGKAARIVSVSSVAHRRGKLNYAQMNDERHYNKIRAYAASKLANLVFMYELARRLENHGSLIRSIGAHPGWSATNLFEHAAFGKVLNPWMAMPAEKGALPILQAAVATDAVSGEYYGPTGFMELWGDPGKASPTKHARDPEVGAALWDESERLIGNPFFQSSTGESAAKSSESAMRAAK